ncbi:MAG: Xaa-Pro peptidase family protein [Arenicellales bacterium]|nr:Xaa-Pro peptidase family protein [Arenicellales bacterium]
MNKLTSSQVVSARARQHGAMEYSEPETDLNKVRQYRLIRVREQLRRFDYAGALLFNQINTRYATDATNMQIWCSHYETRCVFVATDGPVVLFDYGNYPHLAEGLPTVDEYRVNKSFYFFTAGSRASEHAERFADEIADLVIQHGGGNKRLAVDRLSYEGSEPLLRRGISIHNGEEVMELARCIKSPEELVLMEQAIDVCELGMQAMRDKLEPGITENALWAKLHETNIRLGGEWIETRLLSSGPRTNPWFRECSMRQIEAGDLVSFDTDLIGPYGYCADISRAWLCGDGRPSDEQRRLYEHALEQIEYNIALLKPGLSFREVSERAWKIPDEFLDNRYGSLIHGVGLADEYPSLKHWVDFEEKGYDGTVEEGMTLCVESYIGAVDGHEGVKLEEQVLIVPEGVRRLSNYPFETEWL